MKDVRKVDLLHEVHKHTLARSRCTIFRQVLSKCHSKILDIWESVKQIWIKLSNFSNISSYENHLLMVYFHTGIVRKEINKCQNTNISAVSIQQGCPTYPSILPVEWKLLVYISVRSMEVWGVFPHCVMIAKTYWSK